jgi:hypothetical protein
VTLGFETGVAFAWHSRQRTTPRKLQMTQMNVPQSAQG